MVDSIPVLHVDDEPDFLDLVTTVLGREDDRFEIETATRGSAALNHLAENGFECVVSDYDMPGQNGIEFLQTVRSKYPKLPFILFTGKGSEAVASDAITAGATDYLQKQAGTEQYQLLANRIRNAVEKYRSETAVERTEERYHNLVDTAPIPILLFDRDGQLVYANEASVSFLGADSHTELEDKPFTAFLHPEDQETAQGRFQQLMNEGESAPEREYRVRTVNGEIKQATVATAYGYYQGQRVAQAMIHY
ncbi:response regulator [Halovenus marina]|uniref:response regulator n=1 Tax=Halovenus marina TaxID=3396621 RepID=UPI003F551418